MLKQIYTCISKAWEWCTITIYAWQQETHWLACGSSQTKTVSRNKKKDFCENNREDVIVDFYEEISEEEFNEIEESTKNTLKLIMSIGLFSIAFFLIIIIIFRI